MLKSNASLGWVLIIQLFGRHCLLERGWGQDVCATAKWGGEGKDARACLGDRSLLSVCHFLLGPSVENLTKEGIPQASPTHAGRMLARSGHSLKIASLRLRDTHILGRCFQHSVTTQDMLSYGRDHMMAWREHPESFGWQVPCVSAALWRTLESIY